MRLSGDATHAGVDFLLLLCFGLFFFKGFLYAALDLLLLRLKA